MGKRKIFIGIEIPPEVRKQLWGVSSSLQKFGYPIAWVGKAKYHLTLVYLGYITEKKLNTVIKILQNEVPKYSSFKVTLGGIEGFPNVKNPRVVVVDVKEGVKNIKKIYDGLVKVLVKRGFVLENRGFNGHITLGRVKGEDFYIKRKVSEMINKMKLPEFKKFKVTKITLFESILVNKEFVYQVLLSVPLKNEDLRN